MHEGDYIVRVCVSPPPAQLSPVEETSTQREWEPGTLASHAVKGSGEPGGGRKEGERRREEEGRRRKEGEGRRREGEEKKEKGGGGKEKKGRRREES